MFHNFISVSGPLLPFLAIFPDCSILQRSPSEKYQLELDQGYEKVEKFSLYTFFCTLAQDSFEKIFHLLNILTEPLLIAGLKK